MLTLHQENAPTLMRCNFKSMHLSSNLFGTHNLHTFNYNTLINELLLIWKHAQWARSLAPGSACVSEMYYRPSRNIASYSICLDVKCSNSSNHRRLVSVPVSRIRDISLLCYRFQSEWITETAKRSNVVNYVDSILYGRDFWSQTGTFWRPEDNVRDSGTEYPKPGLSRKNMDGWSACLLDPSLNDSVSSWYHRHSNVSVLVSAS